MTRPRRWAWWAAVAGLAACAPLSTLPQPPVDAPPAGRAPDVTPVKTAPTPVATVGPVAPPPTAPPTPAPTVTPTVPAAIPTATPTVTDWGEEWEEGWGWMWDDEAPRKPKRDKRDEDEDD